VVNIWWEGVKYRYKGLRKGKDGENKYKEVNNGEVRRGVNKDGIVAKEIIEVSFSEGFQKPAQGTADSVEGEAADTLEKLSSFN
jgi:hypothetical protein